MDYGSLLLTLLLDLVITVFFYLLVPVILCLRKTILTKKQIKKIVIINGAVVWFVFRIIILELNGEAEAGAAVILWSIVANWLLNKYCLEDENKTEVSKASIENQAPSADNSKKTDAPEIVRICVSSQNAPTTKYGNYNIYSSDVYLHADDSNEPTVEETTLSTESPIILSTNPAKDISNELLDGAIQFCREVGYHQNITMLTFFWTAFLLSAKDELEKHNLIEETKNQYSKSLSDVFPKIAADAGLRKEANELHQLYWDNLYANFSDLRMEGEILAVLQIANKLNSRSNALSVDQIKVNPQINFSRIVTLINSNVNRILHHAYMDSSARVQHETQPPTPPTQKSFDPPSTETMENPLSTETTDNPPPEPRKILFCRKCGTKLFDDSAYCHNCGTKISPTKD